MRYFILCLFIFLFVTGCNGQQTVKEKQQELEAGKLDEKNVYKAAEVGWTVQLPENWEVLTKREIARLNDKGKETIERSSNTTINDSGLVYLINLKKDAFNSFVSTIEPFSEEKDGSYAGHNTLTLEMMKKAYESKKISCDCEEGKGKLNDLEFDIFTCKIYNPGKTKVILNQKMYSRLINGYDFAMTLIYNNEKDLQTMNDMINKSKFSIRK